MTAPPRGFPVAEFRERLARAQGMMQERGLAGLFLTTEPEIRYFTGFLTRFWESPTRPWFLIVPADGDPVAVIPAIGAHLMGQSWISDIRTWDAPDYVDDGVGLLASTLNERIASDGKIGVPSGMESHLRMPLDGWTRLQEISDHEFVSDAGVTRDLRLIKSPLEVTKIRQACGIADRAFARVPAEIGAGMPLSDVFRRFQMLCIEQGADWVAYLAGGAGRDGYGDVISPATDTPLVAGDVLMLDTGVVWDGYFCDFDRNFAVGPVSNDAMSTHALLIDATLAAFEVAKPGAAIADLHQVMDDRLGGTTGRLGHGLGMQLTEWPSIIPADRTVLQPGMVLTLEPGVAVSGGGFMVHEENIVITDAGAEFLSTPAGSDMAVIQ